MYRGFVSFVRATRHLNDHWPADVGSIEHSARGTRHEAGHFSWHGKYLKPAKKLLVDLIVTQTGLDKAIAFANELFLALGARDHRVIIAPNSERFHRADVDERENLGKGHQYNNLWSPMRCTVVYIGTVAIGLTVIEMSEEAEARYVNGEYLRLTDYVPKRRGRYAHDHGWTRTHDFPTGRLCLQAYSPYPRADWTQQWRETPSRDLSGRIPSIVRELEKATVEIALLMAIDNTRRCLPCPRREDPENERGDQETDSQKTPLAAPISSRLKSNRNRTRTSVIENASALRKTLTTDR